jgi:hypothetical protein
MLSWRRLSWSGNTLNATGGGGGGEFTLSSGNIYSSNTGSQGVGTHNFVTGQQAFGANNNIGSYNNVIGYYAGYNNAEG